MGDFFDDAWGTYEQFAQSLYSLPYDRMISMVREAKFVKTTAKCWTCSQRAGKGAAVFCTTLVATLMAAGPPCVDHSPQGGRQRSWGRTFACWLLWIAQRIVLAENLFVHENVREQNIQLLHDLLGSTYLIVSCVVGPESLGWPVHRPRRITLGIHKRIFGSLKVSFKRFSDVCARECALSCFDFLVAGAETLAAELAHNNRRETAFSRPHNLRALRAKSELLYNIAIQTEWTQCLAYEDINFLGGYRALNTPGRRATFYFNQDPDSHQQWSRGHPDQLPALISNCPLVWAEEENHQHSRLITSAEKLLFQCFVTLPQVSNYGGDQCSSFLKPDSKRSIASMSRQAGNSMNGSVIGLALIFLFTCVSFKDGNDVSGQSSHVGAEHNDGSDGSDDGDMSTFPQSFVRHSRQRK